MCGSMSLRMCGYFFIGILAKRWAQKWVCFTASEMAPQKRKKIVLVIPGGSTCFGVTKRLQKWPRYFSCEAVQGGAETDASAIAVRDTAYLENTSRQSQSLCQSCGSVLPTSITHFALSTRGDKPSRPDPVMATTRGVN